MMRKLFLIFLLFILIPIYSQEFSGNLRVAIMKDVPPMSYKDQEGRPSGIFTDLIQEIASKNFWRIEWVYEPFPVLMQLVRENKIDLMVGLAYSEERTSFIHYGTTPIITSWAQIFVHPDNNDINNILDIQDKTIGLMKEDLNGKKFIDLATSFNIKYKTIYYNDYEELIQAILKKEVDAGSFYSLYALFDSRIKQTNVIFTPGDAYFGIPIENKAMYSILEQIDSQIAEWKTTQGSFYYQKYDKYFKQFDNTNIPFYYYYIVIGIVFMALFLYAWSYFLRKNLILKIKENALQQQKFKTLYDNIEQMIIYFSLDGYVLDINNSVEKNIGIKKENIINKKIGEIIKENKMVFVDQDEDKYGETKFSYNIVLNTKTQFSRILGLVMNSDPVRWFSAITTPEFDEDGKMFRIYSVFNEITSLKTALDHIKEREKESKKIIENMSNGFAYHKIIFDNNGDAKDYEFIQTNDMFHKLTGMSKNCVGKTLREIFPEVLNDESDWINIYADVAKTQVPVKMEKYSEAMSKWFDISVYSPKEGYFVTLFNDITERKQREQILKASENALMENQKRLSTTFESIGDGVIAVDTNLRVTMMNKVAKNILCLENGYFGADLDQILNVNKIKIDGYSIKELAQRVLDTKIPYYIQYAELNIENTKETKIIEDSISPIYNQDIIYGLVIVFRDITEKTVDKKKNEELQKLLNQSQKMDSIGQFSGGIAHNFNNIITAINGYVSLIEEDKDDDFKYSNEIQEIKKAANRATDLTSQLLTVSKRQTRNPDILDSSPIIQDLVNMIKSIVGENIEIITELNSKQKIKADQNQIEQILLNFAANSRDALKDNPHNKVKKIIIESNDQYISKEQSEKYFDINNGEYVVISFSDTGCGIPEKIKNKIFDPFFTTKENGKGTGLGLSTVYGIVKQNNATLHVYSEIGTGTTFKIFWPVTYENKEETKIIHKPDKINGSENILFVEDEESLRDLAFKYLSDLGYNVFIASNGQDGLDKLNGHASEIDIVVTDVIMPEMNGTELYKEMKKVNPEIKVLFTSGYTKNHIIDNKPIYENSETYFISKPYSLKTLAQKIREILDN